MDLIISASAAKAVAKSVTVKGAELTPAQRQEVITTLMKYVGKVPAFTFTKGKVKTQINVKAAKTTVVLELGSVVYSPKGKIEKIGLRAGTAQKYLVIGLVAETKYKLNALANTWFKAAPNFVKLPTAPKAKPAAVEPEVAKAPTKAKAKTTPVVEAPKAKAKAEPKAVTAEPAPRKNQAQKPAVKAAPKSHAQPHAHKQGKEIKVKVQPLKSQSGKKHKVAI